MNIKNITALKRAAKDFGVPLPGKPITATFRGDTPTSGVFGTELSDGSQYVYTYDVLPVRGSGSHPLNKRKRGQVLKGYTLYLNLIPIPHESILTTLLNN